MNETLYVVFCLPVVQLVKYEAVCQVGGYHVFGLSCSCLSRVALGMSKTLHTPKFLSPKSDLVVCQALTPGILHGAEHDIHYGARHTLYRNMPYSVIKSCLHDLATHLAPGHQCASRQDTLHQRNSQDLSINIEGL